MRSICGPTIPVILVGCKADLRPAEDDPAASADALRRYVTREQGERVAHIIGARAYKECSALKIEGVDERAYAQTLAEQTRTGEGRENVVFVLLGRGASDEKVDHWLKEAAGVEGFIGFAIGRSIWWDALKGYLDESLSRTDAAEKIADNYLRFIEVYEGAVAKA